MKSIYINSIVILNVHGIDYYCVIVGISKGEAVNLLKYVDSSKQVDSQCI